MLRRLAIIAIGFTLTACTNDSYAPTGVSFTREVGDDPTTVPQGWCDDTALGSDQRLIPLCVDNGAPWPDDLLDVRARHEYENVNVRARLGAGLEDKSRLF
jgi:hypothetical protein